MEKKILIEVYLEKFEGNVERPNEIIDEILYKDGVSDTEKARVLKALQESLDNTHYLQLISNALQVLNKKKGNK